MMAMVCPLPSPGTGELPLEKLIWLAPVSALSNPYAARICEGEIPPYGLGEPSGPMTWTLGVAEGPAEGTIRSSSGCTSGRKRAAGGSGTGRRRKSVSPASENRRRFMRTSDEMCGAGLSEGANGWPGEDNRRKVRAAEPDRTDI